MQFAMLWFYQGGLLDQLGLLPLAAPDSRFRENAWTPRA